VDEPDRAVTTRYARRVCVRALAAVAATVAGAACHVTTTLDATRAGATTHEHHPDQPTPRRATIALGDDGRLRFVEPLDCPTEDVIAQVSTTETATRANLATFVVGVILTSAGAIATARGALDSDGASIGLGVAGAAAGLALVIGPWLGVHTDVQPGPALAPLRRPGPSEPCGARPLAARTATLSANGFEIFGTVAADGAFSVSPYTVLDAYQLSTVTAWDVTAKLDGDGPPRTVNAILEGGALAKAAPAFLAHADFDGAIEPMRVVPGIEADPPSVRLVHERDGDVVRVVLAVRNAGPGDAYALRGAIASPIAALDGRILYFGHVARGQGAARDFAIPVSPAAAAALRGAIVDVSVELRDAFGTAPATPLRFHGPLRSDDAR
jgi:hypothetical protein